MTTPTHDLINGLSYLELDSLAKTVAERMLELRENGLQKLHDDFEAQAAALGLSLPDILAIAKKRKRHGRVHKDNGNNAATGE